MWTLRVAAGQAPATCSAPELNAATAADLTRQAGVAGARLLALPEAFLTNYCPQAFVQPPTVPELLTLLEPVAEAAVAEGVTVVLSAPVDHGTRRTLSSVVVRPDGAVTVPYDKQYLSGPVELERFVPGTHGTSVDVEGWEVALSICYDSSFPEHAQIAAEDGADVYLNSGAFFSGSERRRDVVLAARAVDNCIFTLLAGLTGECPHTDPTTRFVGGSAVHDPDGEVLAQLEDESGLAVADLHPEALRAARAARPIHAERRSTLGARHREVGGQLRGRL